MQVERWQRAHAPRDDQRGLLARGEALWAQIVLDWRYGFITLPLAIVAIVLGRGRMATKFLAIVLAFNLIVWIGFTHLQGRFFVLSIPLSAMLIATVDQPRWAVVAIVGALVSGVTGFIVLSQRIIPIAPAIGATDFRPFTPEVAAGAIDSDRTLVLAGDARAFWYQVPMSRLRYRTVFDVNVKPGQSIIDAWIGNKPPDDAIVVVDPNELRRFSRTYWMIPMVPGDATSPYVVDPKTRP